MCCGGGTGAPSPTCPIVPSAKRELCDESGDGGVPGYLVAVKSAQAAAGDGADELKREALIMAQVPPHPHCVTLIGVVTTGPPLLLLVTFCEHGSLQDVLRAKAQAGPGRGPGRRPGAVHRARLSPATGPSVPRA